MQNRCVPNNLFFYRIVRTGLSVPPSIVVMERERQDKTISKLLVTTVIQFLLMIISNTWKMLQRKLRIK